MPQSSRITYLETKRRADRLSDALKALGEQQQSNAVLAFPPCE